MLDIDDRWLTIDVKNRFFAGDVMELVMPSGNVTFDLAEMKNRDGQPVDVAPGSGHVVKIPVPDEVNINAVDEFAMLVRYLPRTA